jgi:DNA-directed RNA polymerase specialized sigma24 family protein
LNIWIKKEKIDIKINLKTYLFTAVRNQSLNYIKKNRMYFEEIEIVVQENTISDLNADKSMNYEELKNDLDIVTAATSGKKTGDF